MGRKHIVLLEKAVEALIVRADDCADVAKAQRTSADRQQEAVARQHENAHRLEKMSQALVEEAAEIKGELELEGLPGGSDPKIKPAKPQ